MSFADPEDEISLMVFEEDNLFRRFAGLGEGLERQGQKEQQKEIFHFVAGK